MLKNIRAVKFSRLEANPQKQRNYFTLKISQYSYGKCQIHDFNIDILKKLQS